MVPVRRDPVARILDGLLHALGRYGVQRVSMTDIAAEAGISRGTLYRYFSTKEDILAALGTHVLDELRTALKMATDPALTPVDQLRSVARTMADFIEARPSLEKLATAEPAFVIGFFRRNSTEIIDAVEAAVAPALGGDANRRRRTSNGALIGELLFRVMLSYQLVGRDEESASTDQISAVIAGYIASLSD